MIFRSGKIRVLLVIGTLSIPPGFAQKVKVGFDKSADFSKYKSYTLQEPATPSSRPLLYFSLAGTIKKDLEAKGLVNTEKDGDLTLLANGGMDYGLNSELGFTSDSCTNCKAPLVDAREWTGKQAPPGNSGMPVPKGVLELNFVDREKNKVIWTGTVRQKLDAEKREESLKKIHVAVKKLLMEFPPKK